MYVSTLRLATHSELCHFLHKLQALWCAFLGLGSLTYVSTHRSPRRSELRTIQTKLSWKWHTSWYLRTHVRQYASLGDTRRIMPFPVQIIGQKRQISVVNYIITYFGNSVSADRIYFNQILTLSALRLRLSTLALSTNRYSKAGPKMTECENHEKSIKNRL